MHGHADHVRRFSSVMRDAAVSLQERIASLLKLHFLEKRFVSRIGV